jgi:hypothetical protein
LTTAHLPALTDLQSWLKEHVKKPSAALSRWLAFCRKQLESLTAQMPQPPADLRRAPPTSGCKCADCVTLKRFLEDPREKVHRFRAVESQRGHLEQVIRDGHCDLDCKTEKTGRPYTLVCTKNTASYQAALKRFHEDQKHLATIRAIQAALPT